MQFLTHPLIFALNPALKFVLVRPYACLFQALGSALKFVLGWLLVRP